MLKGKRRKTMTSFGPDGRRIGGSGGGLGLGSSISRKRPLGTRGLGRPSALNTHSTHNDNCNLGGSGGSSCVVPITTFGKRSGGATIQCAPIMTGLNVMIGSAGLLKPFQRPKLGRRAYKGKEDELLKNSSLGARRSSGGMQRLLSRAGKGLHFLGKRRKSMGDGEDNTDESSDEDENKEEDRPFEPLMLWNSPFQGGEAKGLPSTV
jgi:hypothetical protein